MGHHLQTLYPVLLIHPWPLLPEGRDPHIIPAGDILVGKTMERDLQLCHAQGFFSKAQSSDLTGQGSLH